MPTAMVFKRYELKYLLTTTQYENLIQLMNAHMELDCYGRNAIHNIYFDTPDYLLVRRSIEKPVYKEKLRVRSYGAFTADSLVFVEMKKKYEEVVYKRRLTLPQDEAFDFLLHGVPMRNDSQIGRELQYFMDYYGVLRPTVALHYEREAFFGMEAPDFRMTFDHDIRMNGEDISLSSTEDCIPLLPKGVVLLEVKTAMGIPSWLLHFFSENKIFKSSFSKYGTAYRNHLSRK